MDDIRYVDWVDRLICSSIVDDVITVYVRNQNYLVKINEGTITTCDAVKEN